MPHYIFEVVENRRFGLKDLFNKWKSDGFEYILGYNGKNLIYGHLWIWICIRTLGKLEFIP